MNTGSRTILYTYWHKLPFQKMVDAASYFRMSRSDVKSFMIKYIRDGIEDDFGISNNLQRRHAFSAKELKQAYSSNPLAQKYSTSNFHFHIKGLVEDGFLQVVNKLLEGRHYVAYYGRSAISFTPHYDEVMSSTVSQNITGPLKLIIKERHPHVDPKSIDSIFDENIMLMKDVYAAFDKWQQAMYPQVYRSRLDLEAFTSYAAHFAGINQSMANNLATIGNLLGLSDYLDSTVQHKQESTL